MFTPKTLSELKVGQSAIFVKSTSSDPSITRTLKDLGLLRGANLKVLVNDPSQPLLVAVGDGRIGVNREVADKVRVLVESN